MDGIIPFAKIRKQGNLSDEDWANVESAVSREVALQTAELTARLDDIGLSVVDGKVNITYNV